MQASIEKFRKENPDFHGPIPADLLTTSESGLDPDLSPASARAQAPRIAKARGITAEQADALVAEFTRGPDLGFLGEPRVNVLRLNLALDERYPAKH
jgi:K+-transporting ATPase ATPase C chain